MPSQKKIQYVASLVDRLKEASHFALVDFDDATHQGLEELRHSLREISSDQVGASFQVVKNSLLRVALQKLQNTSGEYKKEDLDSLFDDAVLKGKTALLLMQGDFTPALQAYHKFAQGFEGASFKIGLLDHRLYERDELSRIATLPSREVLIGQIAGALKSPQVRVVYALRYNMSRLTRVISNIKN